MVEHADKENLGLIGYGPERAMYEAVLRQSGIHRKGIAGWSFGPPDNDDAFRFSHAWIAVMRCLEQSTARRLALSSVFQVLAEPPFGLKDGPIPVIVTAALMASVDDVAIYEEGTFIARLTPEVCERIVKNPDRFSVRSYALKGPRRDVIAAVAGVMDLTPRSGGRTRVSSILSIISPLLTRVRLLPPFAQKTGNGSAEARAVRAALSCATEPDELLFNELPKALGASPLPPEGPVNQHDIEPYGRGLQAAMAELDGLYARLLDEVEDVLATNLASVKESVQIDARIRAERLLGQILEPRLRAFSLALQNQHLDREEWLEYVGMLVTNNPVRTWSDDDVVGFKQQTAQLCSAFRSIEALHFVQGDVPSDGFEAVRITVTLPDGSDASRVVRVDDSVHEFVTQFVDQSIDRAEKTLGSAGSEMLLAALAKRVLLTGERDGAIDSRDDRYPREEDRLTHGQR